MTTARIYQEKAITTFGWFWEIQAGHTLLSGYAWTRLGAEWEARREWRRYTATNESYEITVDGQS